MKETRMKKILMLLVSTIMVLVFGTTKSAEAATIKINTNAKVIYIGGTYSLKITGTNAKVVWSSSNKAVAKVSPKGIVTAKKAGTAVITAKIGTTKKICKITVKKENIKINNTTKVLRVGEKHELKITGTSRKVIWLSSDKAIAAVSSKGIVTAKKAGTTKITAMIGTIKKSCKITVKSSVKSPDIAYFYDEEQSYMCSYGILYNAQGEILYNKTDFKKMYWSLDGKVAVLIDNEGRLFTVKDKKVNMIAENVSEAIISNYGDYVAYIQNAQWQKGILFHYNVKNNIADEVDENVLEESVVLSPDGKTVVYSKEEYDGYCSRYIVINGKESREIASDGEVIAVTNNGKDTYSIIHSNLHVNGKEIGNVRGYGFNIDNTEVLYGTDLGSTHYYRLENNTDIELLDETLYDVILPTKEDMNYYQHNCHRYGVNTFRGMLIYADGISYIEKSGDSVRNVGIDGRPCQISKDGKSILFYDYGKLKYIDNVHKSTQSINICKNIEMDDFVTNNAMDKIYYRTNNTLYYLKNNVGERIASGIDYADYVYSDKYNKIYFICDNILYSAIDTKGTVECLFSDGMVTDVWRFGENIFFSCLNEDGTRTIYMINESK